MSATTIIARSLALLLLASGCSRHKEAPAMAQPASTEAPSGAAPAEKPLTYELRLGRAVFQRYCLNCHGETGAGDGFNAFNLEPHPRDLSDPAFQKAKSNGDLSDAIRRGGAGVGLSALMPPWGRTLTPAEVDQVVLYIRTLRKSPA